MSVARARFGGGGKRPNGEGREMLELFIGGGNGNGHEELLVVAVVVVVEVLALLTGDVDVLSFDDITDGLFVVVVVDDVGLVLFVEESVLPFPDSSLSGLSDINVSVYKFDLISMNEIEKQFFAL